MARTPKTLTAAEVKAKKAELAKALKDNAAGLKAYQAAVNEANKALAQAKKEADKAVAAAQKVADAAATKLQKATDASEKGRAKLQAQLDALTPAEA